MSDARSNSVPKPARSRWTSFVGTRAKGRAVRAMAIDRATREWAIAQRDRQLQAAVAAYDLLYKSER